jgi:hypothetical protein
MLIFFKNASFATILYKYTRNQTDDSKENNECFIEKFDHFCTISQETTDWIAIMSSISKTLLNWIVEEKTVNSIRKTLISEEIIQTIKIGANFGMEPTILMRSPNFLLRNLNYSLWYLTINPNVKETNSVVDYISDYLHITETNNENKKLKGEIIKFQVSLSIRKVSKFAVK